MRRLMSIVVLVFASLVLSGCTIWSPGFHTNPKNTDYYQGSQGLVMRFLPGSPPPRLFYYQDDPTMNEFDISVETKNIGASDAIGALYISGYSPDVIEVEGTDLQPMQVHDCAIGLSGGGFQGNINFLLNCMGVEASMYGNDRIHARINSLAEYLNIPVTIDLSRYGDQWGINLGWDLMNSDLDIFNHGHALVMILSMLDFTAYNGYPFNGGQSAATGSTGVLRGDNYFYPGGDLGFQNFHARIKDWPHGLDEVLTTFQVDSCYGYATYAAPLVCIDPQPYDERDKVCTPHEYTWSGSQGAPVAITSLKQDSTRKSVFLTFTIRNVGGGEVIHPGYLERCSPYFPGRFDERFKNVVYIGDIRIGNQRLTCTPSYEIRLHNGVGTFTCEYRMEYAGSSNAYETPVIVELWYGYHDSIRTQTLIKRAR